VQFVKDLAPIGLMQHILPYGIRGWHIICPLGSVVEAYPFDNGDPFSYDDPRYDPLDIAAHRDPRLRYSVLFNGDRISDNVTYISHPDSTRAADQTGPTTMTGYGLRKFADFGIEQVKNSGANLSLMRYAEILLS